MATDTTHSQPKLVRLSIQNVRTFRELDLDLNGLRVVIGQNGAGKSTILECLEILRKAASEPQFLQKVSFQHGGVRNLLRAGESRLTIEARVEIGSHVYVYSLDLGVEVERPFIAGESLSRGDFRLIQRSQHEWKLQTRPEDPARTENANSDETALFWFWRGSNASDLVAVARTLAAIRVYSSYDVAPYWVQRERQSRSSIRDSATLLPASEFERSPPNLVSVFNALKNDFGEAEWSRTMDYVRLGLGDDVESVNIRPDPGGSLAALSVKYRSTPSQVPSSALSDGTLAYLGMVALVRLPGARSILAFDEPESHLHPELAARVMSFFEAIAKRHPVLLSVHSDRMLDAVSDPVGCARLISLDDNREAQVVAPDAAQYAAWRERYGGLGTIRSAGLEPHVFGGNP